MSIYYVTFGSQYSYEPHPSGDWVHPDGYLAIEASTYDLARERAFEITDGKFAFMYDKEPEAQFYPRGELLRVAVQEVAP